jgi:hypothetical protein
MIQGSQLASGIYSIDISPYLVEGVNSIQYNPVGRYGGATVNVNIN